MSERDIYALFKQLDTKSKDSVLVEDLVKFLRAKNKELNNVDDFSPEKNLEAGKIYFVCWFVRMVSKF